MAPVVPRRRRSTASPPQRAALAAVCVFVAITLLVADTAATGIGWIDALQRMAVGVLFVLAGSRARRWSLIWASGVAAVASLGWSMLIAVLALALSLFLVGRNRRDRVFGGVVGGLVAIALFNLRLEWFLGERTIVAFAAAVPLLVSGYRNTSRRYRRGWLVAGAAVVIVAAASVVGVAVVGWSSRTDLQAGVDATRAAIDLTTAGNGADGANKFDDASAAFGRVAADTSAWWLAPARAVPVLSQNLGAVHDAAAAGGRLTRVAANTSSDVDYDKIRRPDGGIDLAVLSSFGGVVDRAATTLTEADDTVADLSSPWLIGPLDDRLGEFGDKVRSLRDETELAAMAIERAPAILGAGTIRRYLVLLGNPAEARDLGGHLGNWAELTVSDGKLTLVGVGQPLELSQPADAGIPDEASFPPSLLAMKPLPYPQNWGAFPELSTVTRLSSMLFRQKTGRSVDGVMYADPYTFAALLQLTGPVPVPGLAVQLGADGAAEFLTRTQFSAFSQESVGNAALNELISAVFDKVTKVQLPGPRRLADLFSPLVRQGRFRFDTTHPEDASLLRRLGLMGEIPDTDAVDLVGVINRNANPNKIDAYLRRTNKVVIRWDPDTGDVTERVTVTLRNDAPTEGLSQTVIGNGAGLPVGTNLTDVAMITPFDLDEVRVDGVDAGSNPVWDGRWWHHSTRVAIASGATSTIEFDLSGSVEPGNVYQLFVKGQPLVNEGATELVVQSTTGRIVSGPGIRVQELGDGSVAFVSLRDDTDTLAAFEVSR